MNESRKTGVSALSDLVIRRARPEDIPATLEMYNALRPERPPMTLEEYNQHLRELEGKRYERWAAELYGRVVGDFDLFEAHWYSTPDTFLLYGEVHADFRGQGIGSRLHETMEEQARAIDARRIYTEVIETMPESINFLEHRGWTRTGRTDQPSRLRVADANLNGFTGVEERLSREGIRITTLAEVGPDDAAFLHALHDMEFRAERDMPGDEPRSQEPYELWRQRQLEGPGRSPDRFWVAMDGDRPVGVARLRQMSGNTLGNNLTGVDPEYRGRGIARALKLKTVEWAREHGAEFIFTANDAENQRMLAINTSLGYRPLPAAVDLVKELPGS
jgi:GNAT superfamily N-acetyltransferase